MTQTGQLLLGADEQGLPIGHLLRFANRHGLIAGATGTGKTVTMQRLVEAFSDAGVPVFAADIKGDFCGVAAAGQPKGKIAERIASMPWLAHTPQAYPVSMWDVYGETGHPLRTTISDMGPLLLGNLLELTDSQQAILYLAFQVADREGLLLLDLKDLKALLNHFREQPDVLGDDRALYTTQSANALQRKLAMLEQQGGELLFGEPALQLDDILRVDRDGRGRIHMLDASRLVHQAPRIYATFLLWLLAELFEQLPERGDADKPVLALFFDEAHLLFKGTPQALRDRLEQVVPLIRSKGVAVFFVTQSPADLPDAVLAQLGMRIQHGLRAFTAKEQKSLRAVADGFRPDPKMDTLKVLTELGIGEALYGGLEAKGTPSVVRRVSIAPPQSRVGPLDDAERADLVSRSPLLGYYEKAFDRVSAYEMLAERAEQQAQQTQDAPDEAVVKTKKTATNSTAGGVADALGGIAGQVYKSTLRKAVNQISRQIVRGILGSLMGKR